MRCARGSGPRRHHSRTASLPGCAPRTGGTQTSRPMRDRHSGAFLNVCSVRVGASGLAACADQPTASGPSSSSRRKPASSSTGTPSWTALSCLLPGFSPTTTNDGLLRHRAGRLAAAGEDRLLRLVAADPLERPGDHQGQPLERARHRLVALVGHPDAGRAPTCRRRRGASRRRTTRRPPRRSPARRRRPRRARPARPRRIASRLPQLAWPAPGPRSARRAGSTAPRAPATAAGTWPSRGWRAACRPLADSSPSLRVKSGTVRAARSVSANRSPSSCTTLGVEQRDWAASKPIASMSKAPRAGHVEQPLAQLGRARARVGAADVDVALALGGAARCRTTGSASASRTRGRRPGAGRRPGRAISGITSPALRSTTVSPISTPLRLDLVGVVQRGHLDRRARTPAPAPSPRTA